MTAQDLKNSILQRAIQGKLVEQRAEEGTAKELIGQIRIEKENLIKEGKIRKEKILPKIADEEIPFEIPESWEWVRLGYCSSLLSGQDMTPDKYNNNGIGIPYLTGASNIEKGEIIVNRWTDKPKAIATKGNLLITCKGTIGVTCILTVEKVHIARQIMALMAICVETEYIHKFLQMYVGTLKKKAKSMIPGIERKDILNAILPVPPLAEQKRIVAKIEELLPYIEKYDKAYSKLTIFNKKFPKDMWKSILQYAMQGKLVEQRAEEGTGEELYCQIQAEKEKLIKDGKIKKEKRLPEILENEIPFEIPKSWKWVKLNSIVTIITDGDHQPPPQVDTGIPFLVISNISQGNLSFINTRNVSQEYYDNLQEARKPQSGDILFTVTGSYGIVILVKTDKEFCVQRHIAIIKKPFVSADYLVKCLSAPFSYKQCKEKATGTAQKTVGLDTLRNLILPLPPLAEQERIVAELEKYCHIV